MKNSLKVILFYAALIAVIALVVTMLIGTRGQNDKKLLSDINAYISDAEAYYAYQQDSAANPKPSRIVIIKSASIDESKASLTLEMNIDGVDQKVYYSIGNLSAKAIFERLSDYSAKHSEMKFEDSPGATLPWWIQFLPYLAILVIFIIFWFYSTNRIMKNRDDKASNFGKAKVKTPGSEKDTVRFTDVAGADEEKEELEEIVQFLKNPSKFSKLGARIPHGVLLVGPPGTGKTLLAKAVAGEAGVPFLSISGSDFVEMYVGVGASRVRDLFDMARRSPASIVFIDEIDAVGRHRGAGLGGGHDEREQTLNQLLVEMDGFGSHDGIIVMAATNRPDILDPALLRPGRFDRQISVGYPDIRGREAILKVHARKKPMGQDVDFAAIAKSTVGFTGADLANLLNEAALHAARKNKTVINMDDIEDAFIRVIAGPKKKSMVRNEAERRKTAFHEAGHAVVAYFLASCPPVQQISIIPSGRALGYTLNPPKEDKYSEYKNELKESIAELLGGRAAEELTFGDVSGGASNDIERATSIARRMVTKLGMSDLLGPIKYGSDQDEVFLGRDFSSTPNYSEEVAAKIDSEIHSIIENAYAKAKSILTEHADKLRFVAEFLVKNEVMDGDQFEAAMSTGATMESVEAIAEKKREERKAENERRAAENEKKDPPKDGNGDDAEKPENEGDKDSNDKNDKKDKKDRKYDSDWYMSPSDDSDDKDKKD